VTVARIRAALRDVPDFPRQGILFKDITPILADPELFRASVDLFAERHRGRSIAKIACVESRGFLFGGAVADRLGAGLIPVRKKGKLPWRTIEESYELEYGSATLEVHDDALAPGERVLILDDVLATGGTAHACARLVERLGGTVFEIDFLVELSFLKGRERLQRYPIYAPIPF
jgi:adenine phosphoribosyltransferase